MFNDIGKEKGFFYFSLLLLVLIEWLLGFLTHDLICGFEIDILRCVSEVYLDLKFSKSLSLLFVRKLVLNFIYCLQIRKIKIMMIFWFILAS